MAVEKTPSEEGSGGSDSEHEMDAHQDSDVEGDTRYEGEYDEEPDFSDPEDFVDDVDDATLMPDLLRQRPKESDGVDNVILVDGIPAVGAERLEKLKSVLRKIFSKASDEQVDYQRAKVIILKLNLAKKSGLSKHERILSYLTF